MALKRILFFATPADVVALLHRFEAVRPLKYAEIDNQECPGFAEYLTVDEIPSPGISTHETGSVSRSYLVVDRSERFAVEPFRGPGGERRWFLNNGDNKNSVRLTMAGKWKDMLLPGKLDTLHDTPESQDLMKRFAKAVKAEGFTKHNMFWLGLEARDLLNSGVRLSTTAEQSPPEYDLPPLSA